MVNLGNRLSAVRIDELEAEVADLRRRLADLGDIDLRDPERDNAPRPEGRGAKAAKGNAAS